MKTESNRSHWLFPEFNKPQVRVNFDAGYVSSDGGGLLLARTDQSCGHVRRFCKTFTDHRDADLIEHSLLELMRQRVYGIALGYEDLNDHDQLRSDPLLATVCGKEDPLGRNRVREQDRGKALAGKSTLNRLELTPADATAASRYKKIAGDEQALEDYFINEYVRSLKKRTKRIVLDLDATDDPLHGNQEGRFFHGYYKHYCYLPLYIFAGHWPVMAKLRVSKIDACAGAMEAVAKIVAAVRKKLPRVRIILRADSGFCRDPLMSWCEKNRVHYVLGIARNQVLQRELASSRDKARKQSQRNAEGVARVFSEFEHKAHKWPGAKRRVIGKAEYTPVGPNPRFVITNLKTPARQLYEKEYCARGDMDNRIKEQQLDLYADRTSTGSFRANQLRLWLSTLAYLLIHRVREIGLQGTQMAKASCRSVRLKLLKIGALVRVTTRRVVVSLSSSYPLKELFEHVSLRLADSPPP